MKLKEWTIHYIKFRDYLKKQIKEIKEEKENELMVYEKKLNKKYYVMENLDENEIIKKRELETYYVTLNKKSNVKILIDNWDEIETNKEINFIFTNPKTNEKWIIHPTTHSKISEEKSIKVGINTLYESIKKI